MRDDEMQGAVPDTAQMPHHAEEPADDGDMDVGHIDEPSYDDHNLQAEEKQMRKDFAGMIKAYRVEERERARESTREVMNIQNSMGSNTHKFSR